MVKTGTQVAEKFALKYDAYCNMLRAKKLNKESIRKFQDDLLLHVKLDKWLQDLDLPYGKLGEFSDLAKKLAFKGTDILADLERFEIDIGYLEALVDFLLTVNTLYNKCVYPMSKIRSKIDLDLLDFDTLFPETVETLFLDKLVFDLEPVNPTSCFLGEAKVCCHHIVKAVLPFFPAPLALASVLNIKPSMFLSQVSNWSVENVSPSLDSLVEAKVNWLTGWDYRKYHLIDPQVGAGINYAIPIRVHYGSGSDSGQDVYLNGHCKTNFGDIRFTDDTGETELDYWLESKTDSDNALFWVKVADSLESETQTIYLYYGNSSVTTTSNGSNTFSLFDDFLGTLALWNTTGSPTIVDGICRLVGSSVSIDSKTSFAVNYAVRARSQAQSTGYYCVPIGFRNTPETQYTRWIYHTYPNIYGDRYNGAGIGEQSDVPKDAVYRVYELKRFAVDLAILSLNDVVKLTQTSYVPIINLAANIRAVGVNVYCDWVLVRKVTNPEPTHGAWGEEE